MKKKLFIVLLIALCMTGCGNTEVENNSSSTGTSSSAQAVNQTADQATDSATDQATDPATDQAANQTAGQTNSQTTAATAYYLSIPDDFSAIEADGMEFYYVSDDGSSVSLNVQDKDPTFSTLTADILHTALEDTFAKTFKKEIPVTDVYFTAELVSGFPAYRYCFSYELEGTKITQLVVGVDADRTYTFTYTDMSGAWTAAFEKSAGTIQLTAGQAAQTNE